MTGESNLGKPEQDPLWVAFDPHEERERVETHLAMLKDLLCVNPLDLDASGTDKTVVTKLYFDRLIDIAAERQSLAPYCYEGFLEGIDESGENPVVIVSNLQTYLFHMGDDADAESPELEIAVSLEETARIPIREISDLFAAQGTPGGWEAVAKRGINPDINEDT